MNRRDSTNLPGKYLPQTLGELRAAWAMAFDLGCDHLGGDCFKLAAAKAVATRRARAQEVIHVA